ncbi:5-hydroxytryptamine receptor 7-like [Strongylocentrotus purpuratus]|uniref:G-protein coupled receptors family 1 profile domain-containing protein n=1 Tax=Strongylocentrotus purpuratus TaxID=7668 RepID=A0A7M7PGS0_STRPU|nr:5-hydroxytryptamine receptor 7-like [Strongylocentrotus purpuratus]
MSILLSTPSFQTSGGVIHNPEDSAITKALESSTLIMIMLASTCLNSVTMFVILRTRSLRQTGHALLILNLCLADLGVVFLGMSFSLLSVFDGGRFVMSHPMICKYLNGFLTLTFSVTGFVLISCIAVDRLLLIVFALRFPPTRRRIYVMVAVSWLTGLSITTIRLLGTGRGFGYLPSTENCAGPYGDIIGTKRYLIIAGAVLMSMFIVVYGTITFYLWKGDQRLLRHTLARPKPVVKPKPPVGENGPNEIRMDSQVRFKVA